MTITKEFIEAVAPEHGRTSCSDTNLCNESYEIVETRVRGVVVERTLTRQPRCTRCFLKVNEGCELPKHLKLNVWVEFSVVQPEVEIISKG
jgi:hypothetical protein